MSWIRAVKTPRRAGGQGRVRGPAIGASGVAVELTGVCPGHVGWGWGWGCGGAGDGDTYCGCSPRSSFPEAAVETRTPGAEVASVL